MHQRSDAPGRQQAPEHPQSPRPRTSPCGSAEPGSGSDARRRADPGRQWPRHPARRARPASTPPRPPAPVAAPPTFTTPLEEAAKFARVSEDGHVFVIIDGAEHPVGQYPDATAEEALAYFVRKHDEVVSR